MTDKCVLYILKLENYAKTEEAKVEELTKALADTGAEVFMSGAAVGDLALHICKHCKDAFFIYQSNGIHFVAFIFRYDPLLYGLHMLGSADHDGESNRWPKERSTSPYGRKIHFS